VRISVRAGWIVVGLLWVAAVLVGMRALARYAADPGEAAEAPPTWPATSRIERTTNRPTLLVFAHPRCPCSRATVGELAQIMRNMPGGPTVYVLFVKPGGVEGSWERTDLWESASRIPGVRVLVDGDGREAELFGAKTSGHTVVYGASGRLRFAGGITGLRGHAGDNAGRRRVIAALRDDGAQDERNVVFGCPLGDPKP
jgi:hypothetical protein